MNRMQASSPPLRLAFYGDDFTGSTDALEVLAFAGLRCALFLDVPDEATLRELGPFDAIGVAGSTRSMSPAELDAHLPAVFSRLAALPVPLVHYKVCSTFDSAPGVGSIGRVMDIARSAFGAGTIPIVAATPALARYCVFGHLFARSGTDGLVYRLDRHPIMRAHPVTPMNESDLREHLKAQTAQKIERYTLPLFLQPQDDRDAQLDRLAADADAVLFDGTEAAHLTETGRLLERMAHGRRMPLFAVGPSGLEYAMTQWWRQSDPSQAQPGAASSYDRFEAVPQVLAISASASALSESQIRAAIDGGFAEIAVDARALVTGGAQQVQALAARTVQALRTGRSVILHTALGNADGRIRALVDALVAQGMPPDTARATGGRQLGACLGQVTDAVLRAVPLRRLVLSGGDTSSLITQHLAPQALQVAARLAPGAPLCRVLSTAPHLRSLEIALKGGQMGGKDYFIQALRGTA